MKYLQLYTWKATQPQEGGENLPPKYKGDLSLQTKPMSGLSVAPKKICQHQTFQYIQQRSKNIQCFPRNSSLHMLPQLQEKFVGSTMQTTNLYPVVQGHASVLLLILDQRGERSMSRVLKGLVTL